MKEAKFDKNTHEQLLVSLSSLNAFYSQHTHLTY